MQLVVQLRSVFAEYGLSCTNIDGRHCDTVMPSTTTARRANTTIEAHTHRARISPPKLKQFRRTKQTSNTRAGLLFRCKPRLFELSHWPSGLETCSITGGRRLARKPTSRQAHSHPAERRIWRSDFGPPAEAIQSTLLPAQIMRSRT